MLSSNINYYATKSFFHRFDPRLKLILLILLMAVTLLKIKFIGIFILYFIFLILFLLSSLPLQMLFRSFWKLLLGFIIILFIGSLIMQISLPHNDDTYEQFQLLKWGHNNNFWKILGFELNEQDFLQKWTLQEQKEWIQMIVRRYDINFELWTLVNNKRLGLIYQWWIFSLSLKIVFKSLYIILKIYLISNWSLLLIRTTKKNSIQYALEDLLKPLKYFKIPTHKIAMALSIILTSVPIFMVESLIILKAQKSRGVDINASLKQKIIGFKTLIIPLFSRSFVYIDNLSTAMFARGYYLQKKRTRYYKYKIKWYEIFIFCIILTILILLFIYLFNKPLFIKIIPISNIYFNWDKYI